MTDISRPLTAGELALIRSVFGNSISDTTLQSLRVNNFAATFFPDDRAHVPPLTGDVHFPVGYSDDFSAAGSALIGTFIHEMVHVWQLQNWGIVEYTARGAASVNNYDYRAIFNSGASFDSLPMEAQAQFISDYYRSLNGLGPQDLLMGRRLPTDFWRALPQSVIDATKTQVLEQWVPRCFLAGTPVTMANGSQKPIEEIRIGDRVMAFDEFADNGMGKLVPQRVTRTMQGTTTEVIDLRGLRVTPGHRFLSDGGVWIAIEKILKDDGIIVEQRSQGPVQVRARTGAAVGSVEDILVPVVFVDKATLRERIAHVRAGIPCLGRKGANGAVEVFNLYRITAHHGGKILPDGRSVDQDGLVGDYLGWPEGVSPLDAAYMHDWIVKLDGQPFTPQWIADISDADEGRQVMNDTPVIRSPVRSSGPTFTHAFSPAVIQGDRTASCPNRKARRKQAALTRVK